MYVLFSVNDSQGVCLQASKGRQTSYGSQYTHLTIWLCRAGDRYLAEGETVTLLGGVAAHQGL